MLETAPQEKNPPIFCMHPIVIAHDYLVHMGGAERVVASMVRRYPEAPVYTAATAENTLWPVFKGAKLKTSWMQDMPGMPERIRHYFPLYPAAFTSFGTVNCGVAWISTSTFAKFLRIPKTSVSVCYCHNPTRFLWGGNYYVNTEIRNPLSNCLVKSTFPLLRHLDRKAAGKMDVMVTNSGNVRNRIRQYYGRDARIVYPPVELSRFKLSEVSEDYYLIVSRILSYKGIDRAVEAFNRMGKRLVIVGDGADRERIRELAMPNIEVKGLLPDDEVEKLMSHCRALVFPGEEDFGITPVEAMACGKPVIALGKGGALETVQAGKTGLFFEERSSASIVDAVRTFETMVWDPVEIHEWAGQFNEERFHEQMADILSEAWQEHSRRQFMERPRTFSTMQPVLLKRTLGLKVR